MSIRTVAIVAGALVLAVLVFQSVFVVREWEQVVVTQFGRPVGQPVTQAGLHFKKPFVQDLHRFDRRLLRWDGERTHTITKDRKTIQVNVTARWRISDAHQFLMSVGTQQRAHRRLDGIMESAVKNEIAQYDLYEVVRSTNRIRDADISFVPAVLPGPPEVDGASAEAPEAGDAAAPAGKPVAVAEEPEDRREPSGRQVPALRQDDGGAYLAGRPLVARRILERARRVLAQDDTKLGIELQDVLIRTFNYTPEVEKQVYLQMNEELKKIATRFRSLGQRRAEERRGAMIRELETIESRAAREAEQIRGRADAEAAEIYAKAYDTDAEFYSFMRTLEAERRAIGENHTLVIDASSPFYRLLQSGR